MTMTPPSRVALALAVIALGAIACGAPKEGETTYATVPSPSEPNGGHPLTLNLARPEGEGPHPALIFVHGGAWAVGDLSTFDAAIASAAARGYVAITINYRLTDLRDEDGRPLHPWPAQLQDVRCAIRWLAHNAVDLGVDPTRVAILGESAGGHLSLMAAYARDEARFEPSYCPYPENLSVKAVVSMAGPTDLRRLYDTTVWWIRPSLVALLDLPNAAAVEDATAELADASPSTYVERGPRVPLLIVQGTADTLVTPTVQREFVTQAQEGGQNVTYVELPGEGHPAVIPGLERAWDWLETHL